MPVFFFDGFVTIDKQRHELVSLEATRVRRIDPVRVPSCAAASNEGGVTLRL